MMLTHSRRRAVGGRRGFTLIELMVVMAIIAFLAALVMFVVPTVMDKDRARDGASQLQGALQNARMRAMRDGIPRGIRLIIDENTNQYTVNSNGPITSAFTIANSYQYLEVPPWMLLNTQSGNGYSPFLQLLYNVPAAGATAGTITGRQCIIGNLTFGQMQQLINCVGMSSNPPKNAPGFIINLNNWPPLPPTLGLPTLNFWTTINPGSLQPYPATGWTTATPPYACTINLAIWPDSSMGASSVWQTSAMPTSLTPGQVGSGGGTANFGIYQSPRPLLGEPVVAMPLNTCVDLSDLVSFPSFSQYPTTTAGAAYTNINQKPGTFTDTLSTDNGVHVQVIAGYDILFSPSGQLMMPYGVNQMFLWVRDPSKPGASAAAYNANLSNQITYNEASNTFSSTSSTSYYSMSPTLLGGSYLSPQYAEMLGVAGEQMLVSIKANSGATGVSPVFWPIATTPDPYFFARRSGTLP